MALRAAVLVTVLLRLAHGLHMQEDSWPFAFGRTNLTVFGSHHKTGTDMLEDLVTTPESKEVFGTPMDLKWDEATGFAGCPGCENGEVQKYDKKTKDYYATNSRIYRNMDGQTFLHLHKSRRPYRMVHLIRDPIGLVVSGYFHHLKLADTPRMETETGPEILKNYDFVQGLQHEARAELRATMKEIGEVLTATENDPNVLTLGFEDFRDNFNKTLQCMYSFLGVRTKNMKDLLGAAQMADRRKKPTMQLNQLDQGEGQFTTAEQEEAAYSWIAVDPHPVWKLVRDARSQWGYQDVGGGKWRRPQPFCKQVRH